MVQLESAESRRSMSCFYRVKNAFYLRPYLQPDSPYSIASWEVSHWCSYRTQVQIRPHDNSGTNGGGDRTER